VIRVAQSVQCLATGCTTGRSRFDLRQTGSGVHPGSCTMGTEGHFPGGKAQTVRDADHSPHVVPRSRMSRSYISSPSKRLRASSGTALAIFTLSVSSLV
jgi:hypothetical protein